MKKHNLFKVVLISILVVFLLTWLLPTASYQGAFIEGERAQMGIFDLFTYPTLSLTYFGYIALFVLAIGGLYGVLYKIPAYRKLLDKIVDGFKGREVIFLSIVMVLFAVLTSIAGLSVGLMVLFPLIISIILLMGYDKIVAISTTAGAIVIGYIGALFSGEALEVINGVLSLEFTSEIITKIVILVIGLVLLIFNTLSYAKKHKQGSTDEVCEYAREAVKTDKHIWPYVLIIDLLLVVIILASVAWQQAFKLDIFAKALEAIQGVEIFGFPIFDKILGTVRAFGYGNWSINHYTILIVMATIIIALVSRFKFDELLSSFCEGAKKALKTAALMMLIYAVLIIVTYNPFQLQIYNWILNLSKGFNIVTTTFVAFIASIFNIEPLYVGQAALPLIVGLVNDPKYYPLIGLIFQSMYGLAMLVAPTSIVLMGTLSYLKVPYTKWLKYVWKLLLELVVVLFVIFTIVMLV